MKWKKKILLCKNLRKNTGKVQIFPIKVKLNTKSRPPYCFSYLQKLVGDDVLVHQTVDERERVVYSHGDICPQLLQLGAKVCVPEGFHSGHDPLCVSMRSKVI